jgi:hypothetical protein
LDGGLRQFQVAMYYHRNSGLAAACEFQCAYDHSRPELVSEEATRRNSACSSWFHMIDAREELHDLLIYLGMK